jgi:hypothetical protein
VWEADCPRGHGVGVLDQHRLLVPARGGDRPTTPADLLDPLVRSDRWRRRRPHIDNLAPLTPALLGPLQRSITALAALRLDLQRLIRIVDEAPRGRRRTGCLPGLRPDLLRDERFLAGFFDHGASEDGSREEFNESQANRRSSSVTCCVNTPPPCAAAPRARRAIRRFRSATQRSPHAARRSPQPAAHPARGRARRHPRPTPAEDQLNTPEITSHQPRQPQPHQG